MSTRPDPESVGEAAAMLDNPATWSTITLRSLPNGHPDVTLVRVEALYEALAAATELADEVERMQDGGACDDCLADMRGEVQRAVDVLRWAAKEVHRKRLWGNDSPELEDLESVFAQAADGVEAAAP